MASVQRLFWRGQFVSGPYICAPWWVFHRENSKALMTTVVSASKIRALGIETPQPPFAVRLLQQLIDELSIDIRITFVLAFSLEPESARHAQARVIYIDASRDIPA